MRRADNLTTFVCRLSRNSGASTSWNPKGVFRPAAEKLFYPVSINIYSPNLVHSTGSGFRRGADEVFAPLECYAGYGGSCLPTSQNSSSAPFLRTKNFSFSRLFRKIAKSDYNRHVRLSGWLSVCLSVCMYVRPSAWNNSAPTGRILTKLNI